MATRIAWLLNFDADLELRDPTRYRPRILPSELQAQLLARIADLVALDDGMLETSSNQHDVEAVVQTFCPTPSALERIACVGLPVPFAPPLAVLRAVNDRAFCAALGHGLPGSYFARDLPSLELYLRQAPRDTRYVIKPAFSFAGRGQRRVRAGVLDESTRGLCTRSFARGEGVQVEPWVERLSDVSKHGYLTRGGAVLFAPSRSQRCDRLGRYLGANTGTAELSAAEEQSLTNELTKTAAALRDAGYFGPFGIDGFRYQNSELGTAFNARCEINARFTLGYPRALLMEALATERASR